MGTRCERDLVDAHPEYAAYRARVPMLIPGRSSSAPRSVGVAEGRGAPGGPTATPAQ